MSIQRQWMNRYAYNTLTRFSAMQNVLFCTKTVFTYIYYLVYRSISFQIHTVVSGALDRLHYEKDPCVKYDNARKVWIYLHKTRTIEEFGMICIFFLLTLFQCMSNFPTQ